MPSQPWISRSSTKYGVVREPRNRIPLLCVCSERRLALYRDNEVRPIFSFGKLLRVSWAKDGEQEGCEEYQAFPFKGQRRPGSRRKYDERNHKIAYSRMPYLIPSPTDIFQIA
ncbi:hypothetical protein V2G26_005173 [Clonostachys chloroleuca]